MLKNFYTSDTKGKLFMLAVEFYTKCILAKNQCSCYLIRYSLIKISILKSGRKYYVWTSVAKIKLAELYKNTMLCAVVIDNISLSIL